jgi:outer membrane protein assembly factor BamB
MRLWPGVLAVALMWFLWFVVPMLLPDAGLTAMLAAFGCAVGVIAWWLFFSRAAWVERLGVIPVIMAGLLATRLAVDESIAGAGQGILFYIYAMPGLMMALVVWAAAAGRVSNHLRRPALVVAVLLACAPWLMLRTAGVFGGAGSEFHWRWTPTPEERLLAHASDEPAVLSAPPSAAPTPAPQSLLPAAAGSAEPAASANARLSAPAGSAAPTTAIETEPSIRRGADEGRSDPVAAAHPEWDGFRGSNRDGIVHGVRIDANWAASPPQEIWRRPIGPGWSSISVSGDLLYTQEQRGDHEIVACYRVSTGEPVWRHRDAVRFYESNGGAGPRATPTIFGGRVYAFGATGLLNALDAATGKVIWSRNVATDTARAVPDWGFASSPLIVGDTVIVAAAGTLAGYDAATGGARWRGPSYGGSYSSPHRVVIGGVVQVVLLGGPGAISVDPANGDVLWKHEWTPGPIVQPAVLDGGDLVINAIASTGGLGTRRLALAHGPAGWSATERWTSNGLKPYFNDFVVHKGYAYGFDGSILAAIDLEDGRRAWKGGRYGNGQLLLLADQDLLLVLSEDGELALVSATRDQFKELGRMPALDGKTWNHPVIVRGILLVRNGQEMAAFRLPLAN